MIGRLLRVTGTVLVIAVAFVTPVLATATAAPVSADAVVGGCTIVSNPTPTNFTNCPNFNFQGDLSGLNLSYANLAGSTFVVCTPTQGVTPAVSCNQADFTNTNLSNASLAGSTLVACSASPGNVLGPAVVGCAAAQFVNTNLSQANLSNAIFSSFTGLSGAQGGPVFGGLGATLSGDNLIGANLTNAVLTSAELTNANLTGANLSGVSTAGDFTDAVLTDANLTGTSFSSTLLNSITGYATLTGANFTGTSLVPSNQSVTTSQAGAVATWSTPAGIPGATPGTCTPASGSTFPLGITTVTCQVLDASGDVATGTFQVNVVPPPTTAVGLPSNGATITGGTFLDASASSPVGIASVTYEVSGSTLSDHVISGSTPTTVGWLGGWNTTTVPNGTYTLQSVATDVDGVSTTSAPITVTVNNPPPGTTVGLPANGATIKGGTFLDASASAGVTSVNYELSGGTLSDTVISGSAPTVVGWLGGFDSTTVPDGTYTLQSVACYSGGVCGTSAPITITVENAPVAYVTSDVGSGSSMSAVVTPIDTALNQAGTPITAGAENPNITVFGNPIAITPNGQTAYVANADGSVGVTPINLATDTAGPNIPVGSEATCPTGIESDAIAISPDGSTAYVASPFGCSNEMGLVTAIDTATNTIKFSLPISDGLMTAPTAIAVTPNASTVYVTSNEHEPGVPGIVTPIDPSTQSAGAPINVCNDPTDIVVSPDGTTAYVSCTFGEVDVLDTATNTVTATISLPGGSDGVTLGEALTPNGQTLYVIGASDVIPISTATNAVGAPIALSSQPEALAITPDGSKAYVVGSNATVTPIDLATASAGTPITVQGQTSGGIAIH